MPVLEMISIFIFFLQIFQITFFYLLHDLNIDTIGNRNLIYVLEVVGV